MKHANGFTLPPFVRRTLAISEKEFFHIVRDMRALAVTFLLPVVLIALFGYGVSFDLERAPLAVVDQSQTAASRALVQSLTASGSFVIAEYLTDPEQIETSFRKSKAFGALVIPHDFSKRIESSQDTRLQLLVDGTSGTVASSLLANMGLFVARENERLLRTQGLAHKQGESPLLKTNVILQYNPALRSAVFFVPGLVAFILTIVAVLLTSLTIAKEWERGQMEQLFATPVSRLEIVLGKLLPYLFIGIVEAMLVLAVGMAIFEVPITGSPTLLAFATLLFMLGMLGHGLFVSVVTRNQMLATMAAALTTILPTLLLSGFLYPISNMPKVLQALSLIFPARYFMAILRGVLLKGETFSSLWPQFVGLTAFALIVLTAARARFARRIA
jgi:ABC-2 type transport system permease protein